MVFMVENGRYRGSDRFKRQGQQVLAVGLAASECNPPLTRRISVYNKSDIITSDISDPCANAFAPVYGTRICMVLMIVVGESGRHRRSDCFKRQGQQVVDVGLAASERSPPLTIRDLSLQQIRHHHIRHQRSEVG